MPSGGQNKLTQEEVIRRFRAAHGDRFDYSRVKYKDRDTPVIIGCPEHGWFEQPPKNHWNGCECQKCAIKNQHDKLRIKFDDFVNRANRIHNNKYEYEPCEIVNNKTVVMIYCHLHGWFPQTVDSHLQGHGCPVCKGEKNRTLANGVGIKDLFGDYGKAESTWREMLKRCYYKKDINKRPTYIGCSVCNEWLTFSNFKKWFDENYIEGYELDKDILVKGNKVYSPDTCCFVPKRINTLILKKSVLHGKFYIGVSQHGDRFQSQLVKSEPRQHIYLGTFDTPEEAFYAYKQAKEAYVKEVATLYYNEGKITKRVYDALMKWTIEITD